MKQKKDITQRENKGVTATDSDINDTFSSKGRETHSPTPSENLQNVKDELRNVIELMGPGTPHLTLNSSSEADKEDSYVSTSIYSSVFQVKQITKTDESSSNQEQCSDTPRDISQMSVLPVDSVSTENEYSTERRDNVASRVNQQPHYKRCPCRQYVKNLQELAANRAMNMFKADESYTVLQKQEVHERKTNSKTKALSFLSFFKFKRTSKDGTKEPLDLYKINILQTNDEHSPPKRLVFDLIDDIPKPDTNTVATNTSLREKYSACDVQDTGPRIPGLPGVPTPFHSYIGPPKFREEQIHKYVEVKERKQNKEEPAKVDVYYFDHGNSSYFRTTDCAPALITELLAEKTEAYTARFWAEFFGTIHIGFAFFTSFFLQLLRFLLQSLVRPLTVGLIQLASDYFFKPCLAVVFNAVLQPPLIFLYNIATSLRDLADPLSEGIGYFLREITNICRAIRLVEVKRDNCAKCEATCKKRKIKVRHAKETV